MDALLNWRADVHLCGEHLAETLFRAGENSSDDWVGVYDTCVACNGVERDQKKQQERDKGKEVLTSGRMWRAMRREDARRLAAQQMAQRRGDAGE